MKKKLTSGLLVKSYDEAINFHTKRGGSWWLRMFSDGRGQVRNHDPAGQPGLSAGPARSAKQRRRTALISACVSKVRSQRDALRPSKLHVPPKRNHASPNQVDASASRAGHEFCRAVRGSRLRALLHRDLEINRHVYHWMTDARALR